MTEVEKRHPHADANYEVIQQKDQTFAVRVSIPDTYPTTVSSFATEAAALQWVAQHKEKQVGKTDLRQRRTPGFGKP